MKALFSYSSKKSARKNVKRRSESFFHPFEMRKKFALGAIKLPSSEFTRGFFELVESFARKNLRKSISVIVSIIFLFSPMKRGEKFSVVNAKDEEKIIASVFLP
jgi:hypothetical protein